MTDHPDTRFKDAAKILAKALGAFLLLVVATHVGWNLFAPDLLGLPQMRVKGAIGLVLFLTMLSFALRPRRLVS